MSATGETRRQAAQFEPRWLFTLLVPLRHNPTDAAAPGEPVPRSEFVALELRLLRRFGGYGKSPNERPGVVGTWINPETGQEFTDEHRSYQVVTARRPEHEAFFGALHAALCERLRQEDIFITRQDIWLAIRPPVS